MIGVLVSGAGSNLQALLDAGLPVRAVASNKRGAAALQRASHLPTASFELRDYASRDERDTAMADWLVAHGVELVVLAGYMHLLTPSFLRRFPDRVINVHPSLLPDFPGAHAVADQLAAGVRVAGATVHVVDEGIDSGPILLQERVPVRDDDTVESLHDRIKQVEHRLLPQAVEELLCAR
ncbi:MAG TPA: phosphoribosylglycinamide formyltransferase [Gaiellaceae bacterium]|jgi:phosphoribosylglycinamide formyltransferase-1